MPVLAAIALILLSGCGETPLPSLRTNDYVEALEKEGYKPQKVEHAPDSREFENRRHLRNGLHLRLGPREYFLREYDLSTPTAARNFRELRQIASNEDNGTLYRFENLNLVLSSQSRPESEHLEVFRALRPPLDFRQAGWFLYPLGACLTLAVFTFVERIIALRRRKTFPVKVKAALGSEEFPIKDWGGESAAERIADMAIRQKPPSDTLRSYARFEVAGMERGLFLLEIVVGTAPLLGLLGTVTGLVRVFSGMPADSGAPDAAAFSEGIAMALLTTIIGLAIAIPALVGHAFLSRIVEKRAVELDWLTERLAKAVKTKGDSREPVAST